MSTRARSGRRSSSTSSTTASPSPSWSAAEPKISASVGGACFYSRAMKHLHLAAGMLAATAMLAFPALAPAQDAPGGGGGGQGGEGGGQTQAPARIKLKVKGLKNGRAKAGDRVQAIATVSPFVGGQRVEIRLGNGGDTVVKRTPFVRGVKGRDFGRVKLRSKPLVDPGRYRVRLTKPPTAAQAGGAAKSKKFKLKYVDL